MKRSSGMASVIAALCLFFSCNHLSSDEGQIHTARSDEESWMEYICSSAHMGRRAGTAGCDSVAAYIEDELIKMDYTVKVQPFRFKDSLDMKNLFVFIEGKTDSLVVVGAHYDGAKAGSMYPAADDNGSGVVGLLSLCRHLAVSGERPEYTVVACFWAAEEVTLGTAFNGSKYFVKNFEGIKRVKYYCNFDCFARKGQGTFFYFSPGFSRAGDYMSMIMINNDLAGLEFSIKENEKTNSDYMPFYNARIQYIGWNDYDTSSFVHSKDDSVEHISFDKIRAVVALTEELINRL